MAYLNGLRDGFAGDADRDIALAKDPSRVDEWAWYRTGVLLGQTAFRREEEEAAVQSGYGGELRVKR